MRSRTIRWIALAMVLLLLILLPTPSAADLTKASHQNGPCLDVLFSHSVATWDVNTKNEDEQGSYDRLGQFSISFEIAAPCRDVYIPTNGGVVAGVFLNNQPAGRNVLIDTLDVWTRAEETEDGLYWIIRKGDSLNFLAYSRVYGGHWAGRVKLRVPKIYWQDSPDPDSKVRLHRLRRFTTPSIVMGRGVPTDRWPTQ